MFTPDPADYKNNLDLEINNNSLPMETHPNVLGLTLDPKLTYNTHYSHLNIRTQSPINNKPCTATACGKQKEALMANYKAVMRPALEYASSIWSPLTSLTSINKL